MQLGDISNKTLTDGVITDSELVLNDYSVLSVTM